mgnify:CR=1 FL=1
MRRLVLAIILVFVCVSPVHGYFCNGNDLWDSAKHYGSDPSTHPIDYAFFQGYVAGVHDSNTFIWDNYADVPDNVTLGQLCRIVKKYMEEHPERMHFHAVTIVILAIKDAFPKKTEDED